MAETIPFFDGHNDFLLRLMHGQDRREQLWLGETGEGHLDLKRMRKAGFTGGLFAIFIPPIEKEPLANFDALTAKSPYEVPLPTLMTHDQAQATAMTMAGLLHWMERSAPDDFKLCRNIDDLNQAIQQNIIAGVLHMEGAEAICPDLDALYLIKEKGLRSLGPVWSRPTIFGEGVPIKFPSSPDLGKGLTQKGKDLVRLCNELGIMIDLSHLNEAGFNDIAHISDRPLVATHSNAHALCATSRNLTDRQLAQIRESRGMVGLNYATFYLRADGKAATDMDWDPMLRHMDYLINLLDEDHVGLGSDFDGCSVPDVMKDVTGVPKLIDALRNHGYDNPLLKKLTMNNWLGCLERSWSI